MSKKDFVDDFKNQSKRFSEDARDSSKRLSEDVKSEWGFLFKTKNRRERMSETHRIVIDPVSFLIGGIGAVVIGGIVDEINDAGGRDVDGKTFVNSIIRAITFPIITLARFGAGGSIYVAVDTITKNILGTTYPIISGSVTGLCFANGSQPIVMLGAILGMMGFSEVGDRIMDGLFNKNFLEL